MSRAYCPHCKAVLLAGEWFAGRTCGTCHGETVEHKTYVLLECDVCSTRFVRSSQKGTQWICPHCGAVEMAEPIDDAEGPERTVEDGWLSDRPCATCGTTEKHKLQKGSIVVGNSVCVDCLHDD